MYISQLQVGGSQKTLNKFAFNVFIQRLKHFQFSTFLLFQLTNFNLIALGN